MADGYGLVQIKSGNTLYDLGTVTAITDTLNKSISAIPIVSLPTDSTFALESNTSNKFEISFSRKNPIRLNDSGEYETYEGDSDYYEVSWKWTNSLWITAISSLLNRWQARTDGYKLFINVANADTGHLAGGLTYEELTNLFPTYQNINVYLSDLSISLTAGHTEYIAGTVSIVIGGRLTEKLSVSSGTDYIQFYQYDQDNMGQNLGKNGKYVTIQEYNAHNEYNDYIESADARINITAVDIREGRVVNTLTLPLTVGAPYNLDSTKKREWEYDYSNKLDLVSSYTLTGGVENPFEKLVLKMSKRAFVRTYSDIGISLTDEDDYSEGVRARIIPGVSKITVKAVGYGTYTVTECALGSNTYTLTAYCDASKLKGLSIPAEGMTWASPFSAITSILTSDRWGLPKGYTAQQFITNVVDTTQTELERAEGKDGGISALKERVYTQSVWAVSAKGGINLWYFLQACAYMLNAKLFFANNRAYLIDYTKLDKDIAETSTAKPTNGKSENPTSPLYTNGNRLIIRCGLDRGMFPSDFWGIEELKDCTSWEQVVQRAKSSEVDYVQQVNELNSLELHTENSYDRVAGRVYGTISQDSQGTTTLYNTVYVRYNSRTTQGKDMVKTVWFGRYTVGLNTYIAEWITNESYGTIGSDGKKDEREYIQTPYSSGNYGDIQSVARVSIERDGASETTLDLTGYFTYLPDLLARRAMYTVLNYRAEPQETVKFTLNERCSGTVDESSTGYGDSYWSAVFPMVCAARQITDIEQELAVSAIGDYKSKFFPQKLALSRYQREYPSGRTTYTFGVTNSLDLASSTSSINTRSA